MNATTTPHLTDADVLRHIDREGDPDEAARREAHLRACADCADRLRALAGRAALVTGWLERADADHATRSAANPAGADHPPFRTRSGHPLAGARRARRAWPGVPAAAPWLRAAVIVLLVATPLAAVPALRQWVAERVGLAAPAPESAPAATTTVAGGAAIRFATSPGTLAVTVAGAAPGATLRIARAAGPDAMLLSPAGAPAPVVAAEVVRLPAGEAGAGLAWLLAVPADVDEVVVEVGGTTTRVGGAAIDAGRVVDLAVNR